MIVKKPIIIAAIEYKTPQELRTEKQIAKAIAQEIGTAQILQAKVYIVTDGKKTFWINPATGQEILQEDGELAFYFKRRLPKSLYQYKIVRKKLLKNWMH